MVSHEKYFKGFQKSVYVDHKHDLSNAAMLDNRPICKKVSNWVLELQEFDLVKVWIRGAANVLADAPRRARWENALARELPVPQGHAIDLIEKMYVNPANWEQNVPERARELGLGIWAPPNPAEARDWLPDPATYMSGARFWVQLEGTGEFMRVKLGALRSATQAQLQELHLCRMREYQALHG